MHCFTNGIDQLFWKKTKRNSSDPKKVEKWSFWGGSESLHLIRTFPAFQISSVKKLSLAERNFWPWIASYYVNCSLEILYPFPNWFTTNVEFCYYNFDIYNYRKFVAHGWKLSVRKISADENDGENMGWETDNDWEVSLAYSYLPIRANTRHETRLTRLFCNGTALWWFLDCTKIGFDRQPLHLWYIFQTLKMSARFLRVHALRAHALRAYALHYIAM